MRRPQRSTPAGQHRPILLRECLDWLDPQPGKVIVDCTTGFAGHSVEILQRLGPDGRLFCLDLDADNLPRARERLEAVGHPFSLHHTNFAGISQVLGEAGGIQADGVLADLGMSSMQVDDPGRGFSYSREGPLDMRMDRIRGKSAAQLLQSIDRDELQTQLRELGDELEAETIAAAIVKARGNQPLETTTQLAKLIQEAVGQTTWQLKPTPGKWTTHPAARTFQVLRILVNRELANLTALLRQLPSLLKPGGRVAIISFHSGEDRLVKNAFKEGHRQGIWKSISDEFIRPSFQERQDNPRSRSAKLRTAERS
ncbi:MAG: 16S rRNA (cytosine(1402)-N(4))-methyltransferase RsmH [Gemmataceae bacterium]